ncbi:GIY-YIG nuclease family protein [Hellea sp.]|nr:GIY-YIG nuclease family protein [Hellea sp.]
MRYGYVYILCSQKNGTVYIGMTTDLAGRLEQHKAHYNPKCFTAEYNVTRLVWFERYDLIVDAIAKEKAMKNWHRNWIIALIEKHNPEWRELTIDYDD